MQLNREELLQSYRTMYTIREFEERVHSEFSEGGIPGFVHLYAGEEASAVGVCSHLDDRDNIASTHRGQGMMGANGIVGGGPPLICGAALTAKTLKTGGVAVAFVGDGASNQGTTLESYNLAKVWNLPAIFVVEDNGYAEATASAWAVAGDQSKRAAAFGMPSYELDGNDFFAIHQAAGEAVERARGGGGPSLIHVHLTRYFGHFEGDAMTYRQSGEIETARRERDPLRFFRQRVTEAGVLEAHQLDEIESEVKSLIDQSVVLSKAAPPPTPERLLTDVYVSY
jgi:TPP-dependent pyruvate/acetoin dehydrogenase alpha subunit